MALAEKETQPDQSTDGEKRFNDRDHIITLPHATSGYHPVSNHDCWIPERACDRSGELAQGATDLARSSRCKAEVHDTGRSGKKLGPPGQGILRERFDLRGAFWPQDRAR